MVDIFKNETTELADLILPTTAYGEKEGTITIWQLRKYVYSVAMSRKRYDLLPLLNKEAVDSDIACAELIWGVIRK